MLNGDKLVLRIEDFKRSEIDRTTRTGILKRNETQRHLSAEREKY
jgi:ribosomal protein S20